MVNVLKIRAADPINLLFLNQTLLESFQGKVRIESTSPAEFTPDEDGNYTVTIDTTGVDATEAEVGIRLVRFSCRTADGITLIE